MSSGAEQQRLVDTYAERLERLADAAVENTEAALQRSLRGLLADLRRFYSPFLDPGQTSASGGRPNRYSIAEAASRFQSLVDASRAFMTDEELQRLLNRYEADIESAMRLGGELAGELQRTIGQAIAEGFGEPNRMAIWSASQITSGYIRSELEAFRSQLTQIITESVARGDGLRRVRRSVEDALRGSTDPDGLTRRMGLKQRADLIARSELSNAYVEAQRRTARASGFDYVRWIAVKDERACPLCVSRHGNIYKAGEIVVPGHPRCRCSLASVINEAVEETDPELRRELLDSEYWSKSQETARKELQQEKGWDDDRLQAELNKALRKVTPSERHRQPDRTETVAPAVRF
jgi:SPP1 gp7 family putative phage head morphogenesis protein